MDPYQAFREEERAAIVQQQESIKESMSIALMMMMMMKLRDMQGIRWRPARKEKGWEILERGFSDP